jgi:hypothetical protein
MSIYRWYEKVLIAVSVIWGIFCLYQAYKIFQRAKNNLVAQTGSGRARYAGGENDANNGGTNR